MFVGGAEVTVEADARDVRRLLSDDKLRRGEPFAAFTTQAGGTEVFVAAEHVAYVEVLAG